MSRIGKKIIEIPENVEISILKNNIINAKGPKGELTHTIHQAVQVFEKKSKYLFLEMKDDKNSNKKYYGLTRSLINNMLVGVSVGYEKTLKLIGVGYKVVKNDRELVLTLGYSHPIHFLLPETIDATIHQQITLNLFGPNKILLGDVAAKIRSLRPPEIYHGKGVRYLNELIILKAGKSSGKK